MDSNKEPQRNRDSSGAGQDLRNETPTAHPVSTREGQNELPERITILIFDAHKYYPLRHAPVLVEGGVAQWTGSRWESLTGTSDKRPITWDVCWWSPIIRAEQWNKRAEISVSEDTKRLDWLEHAAWNHPDSGNGIAIFPAMQADRRIISLQGLGDEDGSGLGDEITGSHASLREAIDVAMEATKSNE